MAQWSTKKEETKKAEKAAAAQRVIEQAKQEHAQRTAVLVTRADKTIKILQKNDWKVVVIEPGFVWDVKMPGAASMIVRGIEALERKALRMS